jgi:NAD(P)-dependent dehydrogenase (short-subunit alcohol dehydrogenase family)
MESSFKGKSVLVAGGSSGMGMAVAAKAAALGATVHIVGRSLERLAEAKTAIDGDVVTHHADISVESDIATLAEKIQQVDHIVTTAADLTFKPFAQISDAEIESTFAAKFWGAVYLVRHFASRIPSNGSVTFFGGSAAYKALAGASIVAAVNAALDGFARTLALDLAPVRVNVLSPGVVETPAWSFVPEKERAELLKSIGAGLPVGRVGRPEELADAAIFLMGNGYATGTVLQIDGGTNA